MRVLHLIDHLGLGGAQVLLKHFFEGKKDDLSIYLYALRSMNPAIAIDHQNIFTSKSKRRYSLQTIPEILAVIRDKKIDVLHCHLLKSQIHGWLIKLFWFPKIKLVFHEHGEIYSDSSFTKYFLRTACRRVNKFIGVSESAKKLLMEKSKVEATKIAVIYNFSEIKGGHEKMVKAKTNQKITLGIVGRLCEQKGCDILIKALPLLEFDYELLIAGDGPQREYLTQLAQQKNVSSHITFLGFVSNMTEVYEKIDLLIVPSRFEPFGLVAIEAQISGVPVIASNVVGLNEVVQSGKNGLLFESENIEQLAHTINHAAHNREMLNDLVEQAKIDSTRFSLKVFDSEISKLYTTL